MEFAGCKLRLPSEQVADSLSASKLLEGIISGESLPFDLIGDDGPMPTEQIIYGSVRSFVIQPKGAMEATAVIYFESTTMPPGLRGGKHEIVIDQYGFFKIPESMLDDL